MAEYFTKRFLRLLKENSTGRGRDRNTFYTAGCCKKYVNAGQKMTPVI